MRTIEPGTQFDGKYEIEAVLGSGGVGTVYKAVEKELNRTVAIKILHIWTSSLGEPDSLQRFKREARVLCQLLHPNILRVYRYGSTEEGLPFLVMEYANGVSLRSLLEKNGPIEYQKVVKISLKLASALEHAHAHGIVHRDLKPENIIVDPSDPDEPVVKLIDFGLCKPEQKTNSTNQRTLTNTGDLLGTALYMSPEQVLGHPVTERSDIYSFGLILFEMIVGKGPFSEGNVAEIMMRRTSEQIPEILSLNPACGLPKQLDAVVQACGALDQAKRPQSAGELIDLLKTVPVTFPGAKFHPGKGLTQSKKLTPLLLAALSIVLIIAAALGVFFVTDGGTGAVKAKMPEEIMKNSIAEIDEKIKKGDLEGASRLARSSTGNTFEQWPASQRAELLYRYFDMFRAAGDHKTAQEFSPRFIKAGLSMLFKKKGGEPHLWRERVQDIRDYMLKDKHVGRPAWRALNVGLTSDGSVQRRYNGDARSKILLRELEHESEFRVWANPQLTFISDYTKYMTQLADMAAEQGFEDLYQHYYVTAKQLCAKHGFKRYDVLVAYAACRHALRNNNLAEAGKIIADCRRTIKDLEEMPDTKELKSSSRRSYHRLESEVEWALARQAADKGDQEASLMHKQLAEKATLEFEKFDRATNTAKPSLQAMVIDQFDKNHSDDDSKN